MYLAAKPGVLEVREEVLHGIQVVHNPLLIGVLVQEPPDDSVIDLDHPGHWHKHQGVQHVDEVLKLVAAVVEGDESLL
jgi:hypothetical protein